MDVILRYLSGEWVVFDADSRRLHAEKRLIRWATVYLDAMCVKMGRACLICPSCCLGWGMEESCDISTRKRHY